jgi:5'-nucleotidase
VADYLAAHNPYKPYTDGRITQLAAAQPEAAKPAQTQEPAAAPDQKPVPAAANTSTAPATTTAPATSAPAASAPATAAPTTSAPAATAPAATTPAPAATAPAAVAEAPATQTSEPPKTPTTHVIVAGDTLWDIAKTYYGDANDWHKLLAANRNLKPHRLLVGEELKIPAK